MRRRHPNHVREFILANYKGVGPKAMAELVQQKTGYIMTKEQVKSFYANNKLNSGLTGWFVKGNRPYNKGLKQSEYMSPEAIEKTKGTRFKKDDMPYNTDPIGAIKTLKGGYLWFKTSNKPRPKSKAENWRPLHQFMYEFYNGPIPEDYDVMFLDGNVLNIAKDNLALISKAERLYLNRHRLVTGEQELTKAGVALAKVMTKVHQRSKR